MAALSCPKTDYSLPELVLRSLSSDSPKVNQACRKGIGLLTAPGEGLRKKRKANNVRRFHFIIPINWGNWRVSSLFSRGLSSGISIKMNTSGFITIAIRYLSGALDIDLNRKIDSLFVRDLFSNITYFFFQYPLCQSSLDFVCSLLSSLLLHLHLSLCPNSYSELCGSVNLSTYFTWIESTLLYDTRTCSTLLCITQLCFTLFYSTLLYSTLLFFTLLYLTPL